MFVELSEPLEICGEEDVEPAWLDEECFGGYGLALNPGLDNRSIDAGDGLW